MPTRPRQHGFTIIELLVTMTILGLMLFLVNKLFNDTSRAVTTSVQVSKTVAQSRSINEQLSNDVDAMLGPGLSNNGGYIVIIQQKLEDVAMLDPQTLAEVTVDELRTDQLVFIRDASGLKSMTPQNTASYRTSLKGMAGDRAKVWYGHAQRTRPDGTVRGTTAEFQLGGASAELDRIGSNFILGRQALLFNPTDMSLAAPATVSANQTAYARAANYYYGATVFGTGFTGARAYLGLSDVTPLAYGPTSDTNSLLYQIADAATAADHNTNYLATAYPVAANRLHVNPAPDLDTTGYASWAIAQTHPILAQSCSEIMVDFAADLNGDGQIDTAFGGQGAAGSPIWWYDGLKQTNLTDGTAAGTIGWTSQATVPQPWINIDTNTKAFIFRVDDDTAFGGTVGTAGSAHSYWPYMIRIRYRLHDTRGRLTSNYAAALSDGLDNDGDGNPDANGGGTDNDEDRISGRWFERIITVPRP